MKSFPLVGGGGGGERGEGGLTCYDLAAQSDLGGMLSSDRSTIVSNSFGRRTHSDGI